MTLPTKIIYTQYATHVVTNALQFKEELHDRAPNDVLPVQVLVFSITNAQVDQSLSSYLPQITDQLVIVRDKRINKQVWIESKRWYNLQDLPVLVRRSGDLIFDRSGKLRPLTLRDIQGR